MVFGRVECNFILESVVCNAEMVNGVGRRNGWMDECTIGRS